MKTEGSHDHSGSAYDLPPPSFDSDLVLVGKGTPGGEVPAT
jgi:hypothetical protein